MDYTNLIVYGCMAVLLLILTWLESSLTQSGGACQYQMKIRPCFYGNIFIQNCEGQFLTITNPSQRLLWVKNPTVNCCFKLKDPLFKLHKLFYTIDNDKYYCSIQSIMYPNLYVRPDKDGKLILEDVRYLNRLNRESSVYTFVLSKGLNDIYPTVSIKSIDYDNYYIDDGNGLMISKSPIVKDKMSFYLGEQLSIFSKWWSNDSLFYYPLTYKKIDNNLTGATMATILPPNLAYSLIPISKSNV